MTGPFGLFIVVAVMLFVGVVDALQTKTNVEATKAASGEFPYMVSLRYGSYDFCVGAIVGPSHIVTAARCLVDIVPNMYSNMSAVSDSVASIGGTYHVFSNIIPHPDYDFASGGSVHDIGIIVLAADIAFDKNRASLHLPADLAPEGVLPNVAGWGKPFFNTQTKVISTELMKSNVRTLRADLCNNYFVGVRKIEESQICTLGGLGLGARIFSGGGSLAYNSQLIGIVSHGMTWVEGTPDVYTNVYHYVDWIKKTMEG